MNQLIFIIAFICAEKRKFTQTLNVDVNSSTTENAHTGTMKYLLLCLDLNTNSEHSSRIKTKRLINTSSSRSSEYEARQGISHEVMFKSGLITRESPCKSKQASGDESRPRL